jgi:hypothetical protein
MFLIYSRGTSNDGVYCLFQGCIQDDDVGNKYVWLRTLSRKPVCGHPVVC